MEHAALDDAAISTVISRWIYTLHLQVLSDQTEMINLVMGDLGEQCHTPITKHTAAETTAIAATTGDDSRIRLEVMGRRVKANKDLIRFLGQCLKSELGSRSADKENTAQADGDDLEEEVVQWVENDDLAVASSRTASVRRRLVNGDVSATNQGTASRGSSCVIVEDHDVVFAAPIKTYADVIRRAAAATAHRRSCGGEHAVETSRSMTASEVVVHLRRMEYWPTEWSEDDPLELGMWIAVSDDKASSDETKDAVEQLAVDAEIKENRASSSSSSSGSVEVVASIFHQGSIAAAGSSSGHITDEPAAASLASAGHQAAVDNSTTATAPTAVPVIIAASIFDQAFTYSDKDGGEFNDGHQATFAEVLVKNGVSRRGVNCCSEQPTTTTAPSAEATDNSCRRNDGYETVSTSRPQWRRKLKLFEMKAQAFLEGRMPLPTSNYYDALMSDVMLMDTKAAVAVVQADCAEECDPDAETKIVSSKKWRKKKQIFEARAQEWRQQQDNDAESVPLLSNTYSVLAAGFVSDSSDEDDESHL